MSYRLKSLAELPREIRDRVGIDPYNTALAQVTSFPDRRGANKYGAKKERVDGVIFDSKLEARRYRELKLLVKCGEVQFFMRQPRAILAGGVQVIPDFLIVWSTGRVTVEDAKGHDLQGMRDKRKQAADATALCGPIDIQLYPPR